MRVHSFKLLTVYLCKVPSDLRMVPWLYAIAVGLAMKYNSAEAEDVVGYMYETAGIPSDAAHQLEIEFMKGINYRVYLAHREYVGARAAIMESASPGDYVRAAEVIQVAWRKRPAHDAGPRKMPHLL